MKQRDLCRLNRLQEIDEIKDKIENLRIYCDQNERETLIKELKTLLKKLEKIDKQARAKALV